MAIISGASARGQRLLASANNNLGTELWQVYGHYSPAKVRALEDCKKWCHMDNGYNFRIISRNSSKFSVAWNYVNDETGEVMTRIETADNTYIIDGSR